MRPSFHLREKIISGQVFVDEIRRWPTNLKIFQNGSCHLTADREEDLHAFAESLGMKRSWFQPASWPHYDLTPERREAALEKGALFVPGKVQAKHRILLRRIRTIDWTPHFKYPECIIVCQNDHEFFSHGKLLFGDGLSDSKHVGIVSHRACPKCGLQYGHRKLSALPETMTIGGRR